MNETTVASGQPKNSTNVAILDFVRAVAAISVLVRHYLPNAVHIEGSWLEALGLFGVVNFFVLTCLVLMKSMERHGDKSFGVVNFYVRRVFRLYPLSITFVLVCWFLVPPYCTRLADMIAHGEATWHALLGNLLLMQPSMHVRQIMDHLWTLTAELEMYIVLPLIFFLVKKYGAWIAPWVILPFSVALAAADVRFGLDLPIVVKFFPCFMGGVLAWCATPKHRNISPASIAAVLVLLCVAYMVAMNELPGSPGSQARGEVALTYPICWILGYVLPRASVPRSQLFVKVSAVLARYSYGIYLWHPLALTLTFRTSLSQLPLAVTTPLFLLFTATMSVAGYHLVEHPLIKLGGRIRIEPRWFSKRVSLAPDADPAA